jgi:hypothetical protein
MPNPNPHLQSAYDQLCESYRAIDDMRMKLLGALPLATGTGIFVFLNKDAGPLLKENSLAIGIFGFLVTVGLALYEIYGIRKCLALIETGTAIEKQWDVPGQFLTRPDAMLGHVNEPLAGGFIYPAVLAAWTFVALYHWPREAFWAATLVFFSGLIFSLGFNLKNLGWYSPQLREWENKHSSRGLPGGGSRGGVSGVVDL